MASGGARNRSGPAVNPHSARSEQRGIKFVSLPAEGFKGRVPKFPMPPRLVKRWEETEEGRRYEVVDRAATELVAEREAAMWRWAWRTPQAAAWAKPSESWRVPTVALWVRTYVLCESSEATAADKGSLHRFADQIGLTPAGLKENGWQVAADEVAERRAEPQREQASSRDRLKLLGGA